MQQTQQLETTSNSTERKNWPHPSLFNTSHPLITSQVNELVNDYNIKVYI